MDSLSLTTVIPLLAVALLTFVLLGRARRAMRAAARARQRVVERPNSYYSAQAPAAAPPRVNPWRELRLDHVHEINRTEVQRLLTLVEAMGEDSLRPSERQFLDQFMVR